MKINEKLGKKRDPKLNLALFIKEHLIIRKSLEVNKTIKVSFIRKFDGIAITLF